LASPGRIGLVFAKEPPQERVFTVAASNDKFEIPIWKTKSDPALTSLA